MKQLKDIKLNHKDLEVVFDFLDRVTSKIIKVSSEERSENTIIFVDYNDDAEYYVDISKANRILDYCYSEYFFKVVLSGSDFYRIVRAISLELEIESFVFDLFFRSLFLAIKKRYDSNVTNNTYFFGQNFHKDVFYKTLFEAPSDAFENLTKIDHKYFYQKSKVLLSRLEELNLICYNKINVTSDTQFEAYFPISCNTFKFYIIAVREAIEKGYESFSQVFEFLDLKIYLNNQDYLNANLLAKLDKTLQMLVLISFKDESNVRFFNNEFSDNSYIKKLNKIRLEMKKKYIITSYN